MRRRDCRTLCALLLLGMWSATTHAQAINPAVPAETIQPAGQPGSQGPASATPLPLLGIRWSATRLGDVDVAPGEATAFLVFTAASYNGSDGCNRVSGSYTRDGARLTFGPAVGTQMACQGTDKVTRAFGAALQATRRWRLDADGVLTLFDEDSRVAARFSATALL